VHHRTGVIRSLGACHKRLSRRRRKPRPLLKDGTWFRL
jgi:hypothetical protein